MRSLAVLVVIASSAYAQPGGSPPPPPPQQYPPQQYPPQQYPPPPHQYQPGVHHPVALSQDDHDLLMRGEISDGEHAAGAIASIFIGFGSGQAIQGRWSEKGWIFTLGDAAAVTMFTIGLIRTFEDCATDLDNDDDCNSDGPPLLVGGLVVGLVFRVWEIVDAFGGPGDHNRRVRELKWRMGVPVQVGKKWEPYVNKTRDGGATAGLTLRF